MATDKQVEVASDTPAKLEVLAEKLYYAAGYNCAWVNAHQWLQAEFQMIACFLIASGLLEKIDVFPEIEEGESTGDELYDGFAVHTHNIAVDKLFGGK